jgi:hypothetical protein
MQQCVDGDPRCDFDGAADGRCTFHLRVCGANTDMPTTCYAVLRLASWTLTSPSASKAEQEPALAAVRNAFAGVAGVLVGPTKADNCTPMLDVVVPLRNVGGVPKLRKIGVKSRAETYGGEVDADKLRLVCRPGS